MRPEYIVWAAAVGVGVLGSARITRLVVADDFPPVVSLRIAWDRLTNDGPYSKLVHCPWCFAPWVVLINIIAALWSDLHPAWWLLNLWMAASYAASWVVFHDEDD